MIRSLTTTRSIPNLFAVALLLFSVSKLQAQKPAKPQCSPTSTDTKPCSTPKPAPSVSEQFPFPGESKDPKVEAPPTSNSIKDRFPYPGEQPEATDSTKSTSAAGESSSSSSADIPPDVDGKPGLRDEGTSGTTARQRRRLRPPAQKILSDDERVEEDLSIAHFYQQSGNLNGAYLRVKDALKLQPQTADAHLALAEVAQKMGKRDEAIAEYTKYLELDPDGERAKSARKSMEKLKP